MPLYCTMEITLKVKAPFLCAATGTSAWGLDAVFERNHNNQPIIAWTHVAGKLREAWKELREQEKYIEDHLGKRSENKKKGDYEPHRGDVELTDFSLTLKPGESLKQNGTLRRIRMDPKRGVVDPGAMLTVEDLFGSGRVTEWKGKATFPAADKKTAEDLRDKILIGLRWITRLGADKTVGYGELTEVILDKFTPTEAEVKPEELDDSVLRLKITASEPLLIGGVRIKDNYLTSEDVFSGAVIKGALAQCLRLRLQLPENVAIDGSNQTIKNAGLETLAKHYEDIRFTSAFPSRDAGKRPVVKPLSLVKDGSKEVWDCAGEDDQSFRMGKSKAAGEAEQEDPKKLCQAPAFAIDWKDHEGVNDEFGWRMPKRFARTQTAIDGEARRAGEDQLYTYEYICPTDGDNQPVSWLGNVYLPKITDATEKKKLAGQLAFVLNNWFDRLGKRNGCIECKTEKGAWPRPDKVKSTVTSDGTVFVTLQTDTLMADPAALKNGSADELSDAYKKYWQEASGGAYQMVRFFADQRLAGGYVGMRARAKNNDKYLPFFLTKGGSVFVLKKNGAGDPSKIKKIIEDCDDGASGVTKSDEEKILAVWQVKGLPPPQWALESYGKENNSRLDWRYCPFTRENGYGEVAVNIEYKKEAKKEAADERKQA